VSKKGDFLMIRFGVIGAGKIAQTFSTAMPHTNGILYAIASRNLDKAISYQEQYGYEKAYGSYEAMLKDPLVDCVYIATPHGLHFEHMMLALDYGKHILCEKSFTLNASQAKAVFEKARKSNVFVMEAMWTKYLPVILETKRLIDQGLIGHLQKMDVSFGFDAQHRRGSRLFDPAMGGGALLDIGVYVMTIATYFLGIPVHMNSTVQLDSTNGFDLSEDIHLHYPHANAHLKCSLLEKLDNMCTLTGTNGHVEIDDFWKAEHAKIFNQHHELIQEIHIPHPINGFEYQIQGVIDAINNHQLESTVITHQATLDVMELMDKLRTSWGLRFPNE
jgi:predicted dehydrogenase